MTQGSRQAGSYLDKPGNQGPTGRFFFSISGGFGSVIKKKLGSRQVQVTRYLMIFKTEPSQVIGKNVG